MALLQASTSASWQSINCSTPHPRSLRNSQTARAARRTSPNWQASVSRKTAEREGLAASGMSSALYDLENPMHARQLQDLLDRRQWFQQLERSLAAASRFVQGDKGAQPATINVRRLGEVNFNVLLAFGQSGSDLVPKVVRIGRSQFRHLGNPQRLILA